MIIKEFSKFLQSHDEKLLHGSSAIEFLGVWVKEILGKIPRTNVEKIIHAEITIAQNKKGDYLLIARSGSGRKLTEALYNFALSYEQALLARWLEDKKASDFNNQR